MRNKKRKANELRVSAHNPDMYSVGSAENVARPIDHIEYQKEIEKVYDLLRQGVRAEEIYAQMLLDREGDIGQNEFNNLITRAYEYGKKEMQKDREYVFQLHMDRYEQMYNKSIVMEDKYGRELDPKKDWAVIVAKYASGMAALKSKEDLIGIHDRSLVVEFKDNRAVVVEKIDTGGPKIAGFNLDNLTTEEAVELLGYIQEARLLPIQGVQRVVIKKSTMIEINGELQRVQHTMNVDDREIHDIEYEEMPDKVVDKFINIQPVAEEPVKEREVIEDLRTDDQKKGGKTIEEVLSGSKSKLLSQFKKRISE